MPKITSNQFRKPLVNKRDEYIEYGSNGVEPERLNPINGSVSSVPRYYAILNECIWDSNETNFIDIKYGNDINNLTRLDPSNYEVNATTAVIKFVENYNVIAIPHYAFYKAGGSIIWVEDVNSLQKACTDIDNYAIYKDGSTIMDANLDLGYNEIINVTRVDSIALRNHSHTNVAGDAPQITVAGLANKAVETAKLDDYAVTEIKLGTDAVVTDKIADYSVTLSKLNTNSVDNSKILNNTIENIKLKDATLENNKIKSGTIEYTKLNVDANNANNILKGIFNVLYPVGSIYITTTSTCPIAAYTGTWEKVSVGRVLQGANDTYSPDTTIESSLPNHYHGFGYNSNSNNGTFLSSYVSSGIPPTTSVTTKNSGGSIRWNGSGSDSSKTSYNHTSYDANMFTSLVRQEANTSTGGGVYTNTETVQPPAYVVNIFKRTA